MVTMDKHARYNRSEKGRTRQARYKASLKGMASRLRYRHSRSPVKLADHPFVNDIDGVRCFDCGEQHA